MSADPLANAIGKIQMDWIERFNGDTTYVEDFDQAIADAIREGALADHLVDVPASALSFELVECGGAHWVDNDGHPLYRRSGGDTA